MLNGFCLYSGGKYALLKSGELLVFNAGPSDAYKTFACRILNKLTGEVLSSSYAARIIVTGKKILTYKYIKKGLSVG